MADALLNSWDPLTAAEIAKRCRLETTTVSTHLDRLTKIGFLQEAPFVNRRDRKRFEVTERFFNIWFLMRSGPGLTPDQRMKWYVECVLAIYGEQGLESRVAERRRKMELDPDENDWRSEGIVRAGALRLEALRTPKLPVDIPAPVDLPKAVQERIDFCRATGGKDLSLSSLDLSDSATLAAAMKEAARQLPLLSTLILYKNNIGPDGLPESVLYTGYGQAIRLAYAAQSAAQNRDWDAARTAADRFLNLEIDGEALIAGSTWIFKEFARNGQAQRALDLLDTPNRKAQFRPLYAALEAIAQNNRRAINRAPAEIRPLAEKILNDWKIRFN